MMKRIIYAFVLLSGIGLCSLPFLPSQTDKVLYQEVDSLNRLSYDLRYKDMAASARAATKAYSEAEKFPGLRMRALNQMGFCAFMRMDFEHAIRLFQRVLEDSNDEIESMIACVGMMKVCQRTSMNKEFYDYRNRALRHMSRIREDEDLITDEEEKKRLNYAFSEFYIVSGVYFYYLQQHKESMESINSITESMLKNDEAQRLYYEYMRGSGGMYEAESYDQTVMGELDYLVSCLLASRKGGYVYFEANALQGIAELLVFRKNREIIQSGRPSLLHLINDKGMALDSLSLHYAKEALRLFKQYGDWYQISGTYRTIATCYNTLGEPGKALDNLDTALQYVNLHHEKYYHCTDSTDRLQPYVPYSDVSVELQWVENKGIKTVPEWILRLREQLSRTYSAMDCKLESDYNRNIYLDLLDYTRQDKALESRYESLGKEMRQLNFLLLLAAVGAVTLLLLFVVLNKYWKRRNQRYMEQLKSVFELCRKTISSIPAQTEDPLEMSESIKDFISADMQQLFNFKQIEIQLVSDKGMEDEADEENCRSEEEEGFIGSEEETVWNDTSDEVQSESVEDNGVWDSRELRLPGSQKVVGKIRFISSGPLSREKQEMLELILPYVAWALQNGVNLICLDDEIKQVEKNYYVHEQHLIENKRKNTVKKACLSIVTGMLPYIDRIVNETRKLNTELLTRTEEVKRNRITYIDELITQINEYNEILALWIKVRQGALSLHIESFPLQPLFAVVEKSRRAYETKHQTLLITPTDAVVKADRALTLFMINTLAENARKYTPEGGKIHIYAEETEDYIEISVADTGIGLSAKDISHILDEKVYDSSAIGMEDAADTSVLKKQKGHGFGLMNCKGIIEKYRKTNPVFGVCRFFIESALGKGSRFCFRLPKGMKRIGVLLWGWILLAGTGCTFTQPESAVPSALPADTLLNTANQYANKVYQCNVDGEYAQALVFADSVFKYMNTHYLATSGRKAPLLKIYNEDFTAAEQQWLEDEFDTDYYILLDVRNEAAVAGLALKNFAIYYYNNMVYTSLYKQISKDRSLEQYCSQMQQSASNKLIAITLLVLLVVICLGGYYILFIRRRLQYRYQMEQVFIANKAISSFIQTFDKADETFFQSLLYKLGDEIKELISFTDMAMVINDEDTSSLQYHYLSQPSPRITQQLEWAFAHPDVPCYADGNWLLFPLLLELGNERFCMGALAVKTTYLPVREADKLLLELVVSCLSAMLYQVVVRVKRKSNDIELAQDDASRIIYEENMLHVQNMVLDNCLSTIKHETIYYPNRIKQIIEKLSAETAEGKDEESKSLEEVEELIGYYKEIFTLLSSCAARQLDEVTFRRTEIPVTFLCDHVHKYLRKSTTRLSERIEIAIDAPSDLKVSGDKVLLFLLLESLVNDAVRYRVSGQLHLRVRPDGQFVRFDFTDNRRTFSQEELNELFYPRKEKIYLENGKELVGTEYLICKQIIREHDEYAGCRGCRINAQSAGDGGFTVWFTIPLKK
ncbi:DUF5113 domain-containing protein [Phocaeicola faecicola]|uniref:DUF5113 domain-containing protein n=1 Tax=Phocaeicola faecicola TaxID=2739389 RepID=UPI002A7FEB7C|nr:DUF5113 domain-containing protein [Phocaeicola faecicola]MDY4873235.1 DUF5113 domain-containing protein [Phocaeicola faecicola]